MVKCLIRIKTKVNVHLRMINHCYRDVKIRVLSLGPRLLGRALGALPLFPALIGAIPVSTTPPATDREMGITSEGGVVPTPSRQAAIAREIGITGLESLRDSTHSTPIRYSDSIDALSPCTSRETVISDEAYTPCSSILPTPVCESSLELSFGQQGNGATCTTQDEESDLVAPSIPDLDIPPALPGPEQASPREPEPEQANTFLQSVLRLLAVTLCLLLALLLLLVILAESDLELAFLRDIRLTPEFQQFHYQYFCPLRRWVSCKLHPLIRLIDS